MECLVRRSRHNNGTHAFLHKCQKFITGLHKEGVRVRVRVRAKVRVKVRG